MGRHFEIDLGENLYVRRHEISLGTEPWSRPRDTYMYICVVRIQRNRIQISLNMVCREHKPIHVFWCKLLTILAPHNGSNFWGAPLVS